MFYVVGGRNDAGNTDTVEKVSRLTPGDDFTTHPYPIKISKQKNM